MLKEKYQVVFIIVVISGIVFLEECFRHFFKFKRIEHGEYGEEAKLDLELKRNTHRDDKDPNTLNIKSELFQLNLNKHLRRFNIDEKENKVEMQKPQSHWANITYFDQIVPREVRGRDIKSLELKKIDAEMRAKVASSQNTSDNTKKV